MFGRLQPKLVLFVNKLLVSVVLCCNLHLNKYNNQKIIIIITWVLIDNNVGPLVLLGDSMYT